MSADGLDDGSRDGARKVRGRQRRDVAELDKRRQPLQEARRFDVLPKRAARNTSARAVCPDDRLYCNPSPIISARILPTTESMKAETASGR
jgi:hypothetical protein